MGRQTPGQSSPILHKGCGSQYVFPVHLGIFGPHLGGTGGRGGGGPRVGVVLCVVCVVCIVFEAEDEGLGVITGLTGSVGSETEVHEPPGTGGGRHGLGLDKVEDNGTDSLGVKSGGGFGGTDHGSSLDRAHGIVTVVDGDHVID
jgi:hypothetical protein